MQNSTTHVNTTTNINPVAAHVSARNLPPHDASSPIALPLSLMMLLALTITAVTSALASPIARNASTESRKLTHADSRPDSSTAAAAASSATKMSPMAMQYSTNMAPMRALRALMPVSMSSGQLMSSSETSRPVVRFRASSRMAVGSNLYMARLRLQSVTFLLMSSSLMVALAASAGVY